MERPRKIGSISGAAGAYFVAGELSRLGYIALTTTRNTQGIDLVVSDVGFSKTVYLQVKTNSSKLDFWIVGKPKVSENLFYVFVNLMKIRERPEYYIVPSREVHEKFQYAQSGKNYESLTNREKEEIADLIKNGKSAWRIVEKSHGTVSAVRRIAREEGLKIKYDRGGGEDFPFCFYIRKEEENKFKDRWDLLSLPSSNTAK